MKKSKASDHSVIVDGSVVNSRIVIAADRHHDARGKTASAEELRSATRTYLNYLHDRYRYLELKGMGVAERVPLRLPLLEVFVPLKARVEMPKGETWDRTARLAGRELSDEEAEKLGLRLSEPQLVNDLVRGHGGLIVLGDPGSGKTTFLKSLAVAYATGSGDGLGLGPRLPILLPLSAYAKAIESDDVRLDRFIGTYFHSLGCNAAVLAMLQEDLKAGRALLLLDGLDEVSDLSLRQTVARRVADFFAFHRRAGNKFVLTSRIVGYREVRTVAEGLTECTLVDFDDEEIALFTEKWTSALERQAQGATGVAAADAARERRDLLAAVRGHAGVRRLAANPLLLTILALMKRQGVSLPERRVELYDLYVRTLLSSWNRARGLDRPPQRDLDVVETVRILAPLALWMHEVDSGLGLVKREDLHRKLQEIFTDRGEDDPERRARAFLSDVREYAGLILERGPEEYGFIHLTFEEYLAAVAIALAAQGDRRGLVEAIAGRLGDPAWHEVALLLIGYVGLIQQLDVVAGAVVERLVGERPGAPGQAVVLAGAAVLDVGTGGVTPRSRRSAVEALVVTLQDEAVPGKLRREAGLHLGRLGWLPEDLDVFVEVPPGPFLFGEEKEKREIERRYWMAKYPVTNHQYARFVGDRGYSREELWTKESREWRARRRPDGPIPLPDFENPIFPRVGVTWYEADAYCRWLTLTAESFTIADGRRLANDGRYRCRLPDEMEWERAARGEDGGVYPWGDVFRSELANTEESEIGATTAVCTYPGGAGSAGAWDMIGNAYEWTGTKDEQWFILKGGAFWKTSNDYARCAARYWYVPELFFVYIGFRVVLSLANSES